MSRFNYYELWDMPESEQEELLGEDIGKDYPCIVVELDEPTANNFYSRRFAPLMILEYDSFNGRIFQIHLASIDDTSVNCQLDVKKMFIRPDEARVKLEQWLKRSNYFVNMFALNHLCHTFGPFKDNYN